MRDDVLAGPASDPGGGTPRRGRRLTWRAAAAAVAIAAVLAGAAWTGVRLAGQRQPTAGRASPAGHPGPRGTAGRMSCPARYARPAPWVPSLPSGVPASARLVPLRTPASALICSYDGSNLGPASGWALSGRRALVGGLGRLAALLAWQPKQIPGQPTLCTLVGGPQVNYLIGLTYAGGGRLWVAATSDPNDCVPSGNGAFASEAPLGRVVTEAFSSGRWPVRPAVSCRGTSAQAGRLGQGTEMVPPGATSVTICGGGARRTFRSGYLALVSALNALSAYPSSRSCSFVPYGPRGSYRLLFSYRQGPPVQVSVNGRCDPSVDNLEIQAEGARTVLPVIRRLLRSR